MRYSITIILCLFAAVTNAKDWLITDLPGAPSMRGSAVKDGIIWISGANNSVFISKDEGASWQNVSVPDEDKTDFRDIEVFDQNTAIVMGAGSGKQSRLYLTEDQGSTWQLIYLNDQPSGFYDAIAFWDRNNGLLLGDPVDGFYTIMRTFDGGRTWQRLAKHRLPTMLDNEAAFAASGNTLIVGDKGQAWFTTGGFEASVYHSTTYGETWQRYRVPIHRVNQTSGGYALSLNSKKEVFVLGGDYLEREGRYPHMSMYSAEKGWIVPKTTNRGLRTAMSCYQSSCIATGKLSTDISLDDGKTWLPMFLPDDRLGFYTLAQENGLFIGAGAKGQVGVIRFLQ